MAFRPDAQLPDLDSLKSVLLTSGLQQKDNALWQVINTLIDYVSRSTSLIDTTIGNSGGGSGGVVNQSFVTINNDQSTLPNSRQFRAGAGVTLMTNGQRLFVGASSMPALGISSVIDTARSASANLSIPLGPNPVGGFTSGSVIFAGPTGQLAQNNANFNWNNTTFQLKVFSGGASTASLLVGTDGLVAADTALVVRRANPIGIGYVAKFYSNLSCYVQMRTGSGANEQAGFSLFQATNNFEWRFAVIGNDGNALRIAGGAGGADIKSYVTQNGNYILNDSNLDPTTGTKCFIFGDGTAPSGMDVNSAGLYADDVAGTVNMFAINEAGNTTKLTGFTTGSIIFAITATGFTENNAQFFWDNSNNRLGIGLNTGLLASLVINIGATAEEPLDTSTAHIHLQGNFDGSTGGTAHLFMDSFGNQGRFTMRRANGTQAAKTGLVANDIILNLRALGYHSGGAYAGVQAAFRVIATETWTSTANGCAFSFITTANGGNVNAETLRLQNSGGLSIGTVTSDPGAGALLVTNMIKLAGISATEVALKRSTTVLQTRLADDSAFAQHSALEFMNNRANFLMRTAVAWNNGAAAAAGTLTNAPAAGNPTKWIPVDDNGTTRHIPAW